MSQFKGLRFQLAIMVLLPALCLGALVWTAIGATTQLYETVKIFKDQRVPITENIGNLNEEVNQTFRYVWLGVVENRDLEARKKYLSLADESRSEVSTQIQELLKQQLHPETVEALKLIDDKMSEVADIKAQAQPLLAKTDAESEKKVRELMIAPLGKIGPEINKQVEKIMAKLEERNQQFSEEAQVVHAQAERLLTWISAISVSLMVLIGFVLGSAIYNRLRGIMASIDSTVASVNESAESLAGASQQLASSSQEQASSVEEVSTSLEEISGMVSATLKNSQDSSQMSKRVSELVSSGSTSMTELQKAMEQISEANAKVESLVKAIEEIGEKTEMIDEIVFQTRLLSFNASVEAERAGEQGRGFAVVAQEVGNLAQMSGKTATEISQIVKDVIRQAQEVAKLNRDKVQLGGELTSSTSKQLTLIAQATDSILQGADQIVRSADEQNRGIQQINQSIQLINRATQENAKAATDTSSGSLKITDQGRVLDDVVGELEKLVYGMSKRQFPAQRSTLVNLPENVRPLNRAASPPSRSKLVESAPLRKSAPGVQGNLALKSEDPWEKI